jgi:hypothetical protein
VALSIARGTVEIIVHNILSITGKSLAEPVLSSGRSRAWEAQCQQTAYFLPIGTLYTSGCGPLGCGTDSALIGVRVKLDSAGAVAEKPTVVGMYTDCL